jgi:predicted transcriptional regulator
MLVQPQKVVKKKPRKHRGKSMMDELIICFENFENKKLLTSLVTASYFSPFEFVSSDLKPNRCTN